MHRNHGPLRGHYGVDAPLALSSMLIGGLICLAMAVPWALGPGPIIYGPLWLGLYGLALLAMGAVFLHTTVRGKFQVWSELIEAEGLLGSEHVLDLGCGRGMVLLTLARHLPSGEAVGVDVWRGGDQSGNGTAALAANIEVEGSADRVSVQTGDISKLPFADASFDLVTCALVLHNIRRVAARERALDEAMRVLRPGGRLLLADFRYSATYAERLRAAGMVDIERRNLGWRYWYGGPPWATWLVRATKAEA